MSTGSGLNFSTTPAMGLFQPTPGQCGALGVEPSGKSWLELLNTSLGLVDAHTHAAGFGTQVPTAGLNINADLSFNGLNATGLRTTRFSPLANVGVLSGADLGCLAVVGADLYFVDANANQIRLTQSGSVAGAAGSISGLVAPASVTYTPASKLFTFLSSAPRVAAFSIGPVSVGDATVDNGKAVTLQAPAGLAANYALTFPAALPGATSLLSLSSAGLLASVTYPLLAASIGTGQITSAQISGTAGILGSQLAANTVTRAQLAAVGQQVSTSSGLFASSAAAEVDVTNLTVTITTSGRPVFLAVIPDGTNNTASMSATSGSAAFFFDRGGANIAQLSVNRMHFFIDPVAAGTYTYKFRVNPASVNASVSWMVLIAYEL